ncbi:CoA-transferase [Schaalia vaccimaxillae]|uniref:CoA-transferase n=1 Tax=Schaalia vaccimaxillae TaxID=183916 RepID=UPI0003B49C30|nr:CoA-transferase [Schaalia vaccimaxillae]
MSYRIVRPDEVASLIPDGATVASDGFTMMSVADEIYLNVEKSFLETSHPCDLTWVHAAGQSNRVDGLARISHPGLVSRVIGPHWGLNPPMAKMLGADEVECVCLPQGQISTLYRTIAAGRPGQLSTVGLGTFVDPRLDGGRLNAKTRANVGATEYVEVMMVDGREYLFYKSFPIDVAIIRGTRIDTEGNLSQEDDPTILDSLAIAQAVHNNNGIVICQVKEIVEAGKIGARDVKVPGVLIDAVMVCSDPATYHRQTNGYPEVTMDLITGRFTAEKAAEMLSANELDDKRASIGQRGTQLVKAGDIINLGTGIPGDTVGPALAESGLLAEVTLTVESGTYGGVPLGGVDFGCALHPQALIPHPNQFDFYNGGGCDITFMGVGQIDPIGNVNVSAFAGQAVGCGGFMDIVDGARRICFLMSASSRHPKWVDEVDHLTFNGKAALLKGQEVYVCTEYYTLQLTEDGWSVVEVDDTDEAGAALAHAAVN